MVVGGRGRDGFTNGIDLLIVQGRRPVVVNHEGHVTSLRNDLFIVFDCEKKKHLRAVWVFSPGIEL